MNFYKLLIQREQAGNPIKVGVIGAGKFSKMFLAQARLTPGMRLIGIAELDLQRAKRACITAGWPEEILFLGDSNVAINDCARAGKILLMEDADRLFQADLDVILEITGDPEMGAYHAWHALDSGKHVVMVNVEADALLGNAIRKKADDMGLVYSMAYGDQPALICELIDWARTIGLEVVCAGKGTRYQPMYHYSTPGTVWKHYGFLEEQVAAGDYNPQMFNSFLDGTKSAIEMCAVANASGLIPQKCGLQFPPVPVKDLPERLRPVSVGGILEHSGTVEVVASENRDGTPVHQDLRWGVFVVVEASSEYVKRCFSEYGMQTDSSGEYTSLYRPYHLIGLELGISVASVALRAEPTGSTDSFIADVASVAKKDLRPGDALDGEGGFTVFGRLTRAEESIACKYLPIGLSNKAEVVRSVPQDTILTYDDVRLEESLFAYKLRKQLEEEHKN